MMLNPLHIAYTIVRILLKGFISYGLGKLLIQCRVYLSSKETKVDDR